MKTTLEHLPVVKQGQIIAITKIIAGAIRPEKIILFGPYGSAGGSSGLLADRQAGAVLGSYDLLVVTRRGDRRFDHEIQDIIENRCRAYGTVTALVHDIDYVNARLKEGQYFFATMIHESVLLYDAGNIPLAPCAPPDFTRIRAVAQKDFDRWWLQASAFLKSALFNKEQKERKLAAFLLHQAAEHAYQAILLSFTGYKPCTHNIDKLRRYTNRFSIELASLFPRNTPEEDELFKLLLQGYVDARYKEDFKITEEELDLLIGRIMKLLSVAERVCRNRFTNLDRLGGESGLRA